MKKYELENCRTEDLMSLLGDHGEFQFYFMVAMVLLQYL